jgi:hypothetical protein
MNASAFGLSDRLEIYQVTGFESEHYITFVISDLRADELQIVAALGPAYGNCLQRRRFKPDNPDPYHRHREPQTAADRPVVI